VAVILISSSIVAARVLINIHLQLWNLSRLFVKVTFPFVYLPLPLWVRRYLVLGTTLSEPVDAIFRTIPSFIICLVKQAQMNAFSAVQRSLIIVEAVLHLETVLMSIIHARKTAKSHCTRQTKP